MKYGRRILIVIAYMIVGVVLNVLSFMGKIDSFWSGFGASLIIIGLLQLFKHFKYRTNKDYKEKVDVELNDERNKYIRNKAWAWSGYLFVIVAAIMTVVFKLLQREDLMMLCSGCVCFFVVVYYISYMILKRKY